MLPSSVFHFFRKTADLVDSEFNIKTVALNLDREVLHLFVDYDRRWRSSRLGIVCANGINDRLNGAVRGSLRGLTSVRLNGWTSFKFSCD